MELCEILKYDRSLYLGKAVFYYQTPDSDFVPLQASVARIRGQKVGITEGYNADSTPKNLAPQDLAYANPIIIEECYVPPNISELYCRFSLRVKANSLAPSGCSDVQVFNTLSALAAKFKEHGGYQELAKRYCKNILLGTWLWRNQYAGATSITVVTSNESTYVISDIREISWESHWPAEALEALNALTDEFLLALTNPSAFWHADITAKMDVAFCQEVFPSQLLLTEKLDGVPTKQFAKVRCIDGTEAVSFNSVKIGAAIQSIDDWWSPESNKRLRVHEYGGDGQIGIAHRRPEFESDFYSYFINADHYLLQLEQIGKESFAAEMSHSLNYLFAVLIKGGMFQQKRANRVKKQQEA
ncbi:CRISPR type I-F/YPEST-associated protein Csy3 [Shewanella putrefaciens]|uniref:type I-F CRISPR-associated protein Csy3 n=1 Tax=Shewanella putrefaciens TaxID=24 RepID=UPI000E0468BD|nr:type I-F CRISPR-associated protein Csy3 [Shewanella putrefaciens]SUI78983.1 CRISPR type I-F/YPEST-associated protein Csy3 [Shewanella putrefaciens]